MPGLGLIAAYAIFGSLAVAAVLAIVWLASQLLWSGFKDNFLSPALEVVQHLRRKRT